MTINGLHAPIVPDAEFDGLLTLHTLLQDIEVLVEITSEVFEKDTFQLLLNGELTGPSYQVPTVVPKPDTTLTFVIQKEAFREGGIYQVAYRFTTFPGNTTSDSISTQIRIDRTAPGATLLAAMVLPDAPFDDHVTGLIPGYAGMERGDVIQTLCNGVPGPIHTVQEDELNLYPVAITFQRTFLESTSIDNVVMEYRVTDRAGNQSIVSSPSQLSLER